MTLYISPRKKAYRIVAYIKRTVKKQPRIRGVFRDTSIALSNTARLERVKPSLNISPCIIMITDSMCD